MELNAWLQAHGYMACCMSTMPAPTETPIYNLEDALGLKRHNFSCLIIGNLLACYFCMCPSLQKVVA